MSASQAEIVSPNPTTSAGSQAVIRTVDLTKVYPGGVKAVAQAISAARTCPHWSRKICSRIATAPRSGAPRSRRPGGPPGSARPARSQRRGLRPRTGGSRRSPLLVLREALELAYRRALMDQHHVLHRFLLSGNGRLVDERGATKSTAPRAWLTARVASMPRTSPSSSTRTLTST